MVNEWTNDFQQCGNPDMTDYNWLTVKKLNKNKWNPDLWGKRTMTRLRRLFRNSFLSPIETQAVRQRDPFVIEAPSLTESLTAKKKWLFLCQRVFSACFCVLHTCWLCCWSSCSCWASRECKEAKLALSSAFSRHAFSKRCPSSSSFCVRSNIWGKQQQQQYINTDLA